VPSPVADLLAAVDLEEDGVVSWGQPIPSTAPGVYVVSLSADPGSVAGVIPATPISAPAISELLYLRQELTVDGARPSGEVLTRRVSEFWLADVPPPHAHHSSRQTISIWKNSQTTAAYAYGQKRLQHSKAIAEQERKDFHRQSAFVRFAPLRAEGL